MPNYQKLYTLLFNAITSALEQLEKRNVGAAGDILIRAQREAEDAYISEEE